MPLSCTILETMSGDIRISNQTYSITFYIEAYTEHPLKISAPRTVTGYCEWNGNITLPIEGSLSLLPSGPKYDIKIPTSPLGPLFVTGKKHYQIRSLVHSLTHCPVKVYSQEGKQHLGDGEIAYRQPLWKFPLESLRFSI